MKSKLYSLLEQGILKKPRKILVTYRSLIEPVNADATIGQFTLYGVISNDDPPIALSDTINLYPSTDADHPYRTTTVDIDPVKEVTSVFFTLINPDNDFNLNCIINHIELITEQGNIPIGLGILEPEALAATSITTTGFTANWTEIDEANGYKIDVSTDIEFNTFVTGYENKDIPGGTTTALAITGLDDNECYFYRIRSYNTTFTSLNSNIVHVLTHIETPEYYAIAANVTGNDFFKGTCIKFDGINSAIYLHGLYSLPTKWSLLTWVNRPSAGLLIDYILTLQNNETGGSGLLKIYFDSGNALVCTILNNAGSLIAIRTAGSVVPASSSDWYSVVVSYDHTIPICKIYINGSNVLLNPAYDTATPDNPAVINQRALFGYLTSTSPMQFHDFILASGAATASDAAAFHADPNAVLSVTKYFHLPCTDTADMASEITDYAYLMKNQA